MWSELRTLFWLQWKLTSRIFRTRGTSDALRLLQVLSRALVLLITFPSFVVLGGGLAVGLILLSPSAAYELAMVVNVFLFGVWLLLPASYSSQIIERFDMSTLFPHPVRFRSIVVGSTLMSMLTMTGLWTAPILLGEIVGLAWHQPLALPLIVVGALPTYAFLVLTGRIMDDFFDLVSGDRRLRAWVIGLLTLPFMLCWAGQYLTQLFTENYTALSRLARIPLLKGLEQAAAANDPVAALEILQPSRWLIWLPPGWAAAGMGLALKGEWGRSVLFLALSTAFAALLLWVHAGITRRLMDGAALGLGAERVRTRRRMRLPVPGPPAFWALFRKDWLYLLRSPMPRRMVFSALVMAVSMTFPLRGIAQSRASSTVREALPLLAGGLAVTMVGMVINMAMTANYFGTIDRDGFAVLAHSPLDRRYAILSANLAVLLYASAMWFVLSLGVALLTRSWQVFPMLLYMGTCLQIGGTPAYNLAAIIGPYRTQLKFSRSRRQGNFWGMLAWAVSAPPVLAFIVLPYVFWRPGLFLTLPLGAAYSIGLYALTLKPLARLLQRREYEILRAVTAEE